MPTGKSKLQIDINSLNLPKVEVHQIILRVIIGIIDSSGDTRTSPSVKESVEFDKITIGGIIGNGGRPLKDELRDGGKASGIMRDEGGRKVCALGTIVRLLGELPAVP